MNRAVCVCGHHWLGEGTGAALAGQGCILLLFWAKDGMALAT